MDHETKFNEWLTAIDCKAINWKQPVGIGEYKIIHSALGTEYHVGVNGTACIVYLFNETYIRSWYLSTQDGNY